MAFSPNSINILDKDWNRTSFEAIPEPEINISASLNVMVTRYCGANPNEMGMCAPNYNAPQLRHSSSKYNNYIKNLSRKVQSASRGHHFWSKTTRSSVATDHNVQTLAQTSTTRQSAWHMYLENGNAAQTPSAQTFLFQNQMHAN